jgi:GTPase KRas protein
MKELYIRNAEGFVLLYSINSRTSFDEVQSSVDLIRRVKDMDNNIPIPLILVYSHIDTYNIIYIIL